MISNFSLNMGADTVIHEGTLEVYRMKDGSSEKIFGPKTYIDIQQNKISADFERPDEYDVFYGVFTINLYSTGADKSVKHPEVDFQLLSLFLGKASEILIASQSTIAAAYACAQMITISASNDISIACPVKNQVIPYSMKCNFISDDGKVSDVISQSPNGLETNSYPMFNFLSALYTYMLIDDEICEDFGKFTAGENKPAFQSLMNLVLNPHNTNNIFGLIDRKPEIFTPSLTDLTLPDGKSPVPRQWTLTIKVNDSGAQNFLPSGLAYVVFDKNNRAWITNNFRAGSAFSGTHCLVMDPDGSPASFSPITGGGLLGSAFGAAVNAAGNEISIGNFGWGPELFNPQHGSISRFNSEGEAISPQDGYINGLSRVQGMCFDKDKNLWMASVGTQKPFAPAPAGVYPNTSENSAIVVYRGGDPKQMVSFSDFLGKPSPDHSTFDVIMDNEGNAIVSNIGSKDAEVRSSVHKFRLTDSGIELLSSWVSDYTSSPGETGYEELRQVAVNKKNEVFVVAISSNRLYKIDMREKVAKTVQIYEKNINAPWGVIIDKAGTIFISNFGKDTERVNENTLDMKGLFGVTVIRNEDESTAQLWTLPTGGWPVTLRNGQGLYGTYSDGWNKSIEPVCYEPLMRLTASGIDRGGNLWALNNWKPSKIDDVKDNPGGDGAVIFLGVASPLE